MLFLEETLKEIASLAILLFEYIGVVVIIFAGIRERLQYAKIPKPLQGFPVALISAGLMAIAFMGFYRIY